MPRWKPPLNSWLVLALLLGTLAYAIAEEITLTTYYPSPRGVYSELRVGAGGPFPAPTGTLHVIKSIDDGNVAFRVDDEADDLSPFVIDETGNVGVGTTAPSQKLEVNGGIQIGDTTTDTAGTIRFDGTNFQGRDATEWMNFMRLPTTSNVKMEYVSGASSTCPAGSGTWLIRKWTASPCTDPQGCPGCSTPGGWSAQTPTCTYPRWACDASSENCACGWGGATGTCSSNTWTEVVCMGN